MPAGDPRGPDAVEELVRRLLEGDRRALARVISYVEDGVPEGRQALSLLYPRTGRAHTVGVTGPPGSGKSTLVCALARELRSRGRGLGIIAVDPSSAFSHGALLGDRIRMQELTADPQVFVRSMATRGFLGGLAAATAEVVAVLDAAGKDVVLIETVGAGQDEVEIAGAAQTTILLSTPAGGDDIQTMKAGVLEVADILVVNKADLPGADTLAAQLASMLSLSPPSARAVPVLKTVAVEGGGVPELAGAVEEHRRYLEESGELERHRLYQARRQILALVRHRLVEDVLRRAGSEQRLDELARAVSAREIDPYSAARSLIAAAGA